MNIVLLSGGSGKRLWPLSNEIRSKQFLKLLKDDKDRPESMVQRVYRQIRGAGIDANIVVATGMMQVDAIKNQLGGNVDIVVEPERRDTFPAIALASCYLYFEKHMAADEVVVVLPVDPYAGMSYFETLESMEKAVLNNAADIVLMGIEPTYPSAKYGYILCEHGNGVRAVKRFTEKPDEELAARLIESGAMWNGGVFAFRLGYLLSIVNKYIDVQTFEDARSKYSELKKISFDYEVVEKAESVAVVPYDGEWKDLGTWNTVTEHMGRQVMGSGILAGSCENTHIVNELDIPVVAMGIKDAIIAASPDGILVTDKHESSYIKPVVDTIVQRPMYEERYWGEYRVLDCYHYEDKPVSVTKRIIVMAGQCTDYHDHKNVMKSLTFISGKGTLTIDGENQSVQGGQAIMISKGRKYSVEAETDLHYIEVQVGI